MYAFLFTLSLLGVGSDEQRLTGQPDWFPLGGEVYHARDRVAAERAILEFRPQPHWFLGFPKPATPEQFAAWLKTQPGQFDLQKPVDGEFQIPTTPARPERLSDLSLKDQGASLKFTVEPSTDPDLLEFGLDLSADERAIQREIEHRHTNVIPFLFAFYVDGKAVRKEEQAFEKDGGSKQLVELVPTKSHRHSKLRVARKSLETILPAHASEVTIVAAFSERQHAGATDQLQFDGEVWDLEHIPRQILIRSNAVNVRMK